MYAPGSNIKSAGHYLLLDISTQTGLSMMTPRKCCVLLSMCWSKGGEHALHPQESLVISI